LPPPPLARCREHDPHATLEAIIAEIQAYLGRHGGTGIVDVDCVAAVVAEMSRDDEDVAKESVLLYDGRMHGGGGGGGGGAVGPHLTPIVTASHFAPYPCFLL
jgi:hypothetical protein